MINLNFCYRIYPDANQEAILLQWLETCRKVYNYALQEVKDWLNSRKSPIDACSLHSEYILPADHPFPDLYTQQKALTQAKKTNPDLKAVDSHALRTPLIRLHNALDRKKKLGAGFPRFKKFGQFRSINFSQIGDQPLVGDIIAGYRIKIPKIKTPIAIKLHRSIPDGFVMKQITVVKKASGWYAVCCIQMDADIPDPVKEGTAIGVDLGLNFFAATSEGQLIARPRFLVDLQSKLKSLQRKMSKKVKGSKNWHKAKDKVALLHEKIANARKDFHYKKAHEICKQADIIFVEDLSVKGLSRGFLAKHILDAGFGSFLEILKQVARKLGKYFEKVCPNHTSQTCPQCGAIKKKLLSERVHRCDCGCVLDRDVAAAIIVKQKGLAAVGLTVKLSVEEEFSGVTGGQPSVTSGSPEKQKILAARLRSVTNKGDALP